MTATVTAAPSIPSSGQLVVFTVSGVNDAASGTCAPANCATDGNGQVTFTYTDENGPGVDTVTGTITDFYEFQQRATASVVWEAPSCTEDGLQSVPAGGAASAAVHQRVEPVATDVGNELGAPSDLGTTVHEINCMHVVPWEGVIDLVVAPWLVVLRNLIPLP